ncbi:hypothetical protein HAX54_049748, partial [Datura stramonium]|nr:hypothetical protein [Datura stramonium]
SPPSPSSYSSYRRLAVSAKPTTAEPETGVVLSSSLSLSSLTSHISAATAPPLPNFRLSSSPPSSSLPHLLLQQSPATASSVLSMPSINADHYTALTFILHSAASAILLQTL